MGDEVSLFPTRGGGKPPPLPSRGMGTTRQSGRDVERVTGPRTLGVWIHFDSTNVEMAKLDPQYDLETGGLTGVGTITIQFLDGSQYEYADRPNSDFYDLVESSSKGSFGYYEIRGPGKSRKGMGLWKPCVQIREATRTPSQVAALAGKRQPRTPAQRQRRYTVGGKRQAYARGGRAAVG